MLRLEFFKKAFKTYMPGYIVDGYRKILIQYRYWKVRKLLQKNQFRKPLKRCVYILGNGPSINEINLRDTLVGEDVIVMNSFYRHRDATKLNIVAYCVGETGNDVDKVSLEEILSTQAQRYVFSTDFKFRLAPLGKKNYLYMPGCDNQLKFKNRAIDLTRPAPFYETTAQMSIIIAMAMGYRKIVLLGFDHNFLACGKYLDHFYAESDDDLFRSKMYVDKADYHDLIKNCERMWARYKMIRYYAITNNIKILNCGNQSYLDVFRRASLNVVLKS
jgi:hypothetical protein